MTMNDTDMVALARVLCHEWDNEPAHPCGEPHPCPAHLREAEAVFASGLVVSAGEVKALISAMDVWRETGAMVTLGSIQERLRRICYATDAAPE